MIRIRLLLALFSLTVSHVAQAAPFVAPRDPQCVAFSQQGTRVALGFSGQSNGEFPPRPHPDVRKCGCVQIHEAASGKRLRRIETYGDLVDVRFSPDGKLLAMARLFTTAEGISLDEVRVWNVADGKVLHTFDRCHAFAFDPQEPRIVVLGRKTCAEFDLETGERRRVFPTFESALAVQFVAPERLAGIVRTEEPTSRYTLRLLDTRSGEMLRDSVPLEQPFYTIAVAPGGRFLATGHEGGEVLLWDAVELKPLARLETGTRGIAHPFISPDAELIAAGDQTTGDVVIWKLSSGQELERYTFQKGGFRPHTMRAEAVRERPERDPARFVFTPGSDAFLSGCYGGIVRLVSSGQDVLRYTE